MRSKSLSYEPNPSARAEWLFALSLMEACSTGDMSSLLTVDPATTTMPTPRLTQRYQKTTTTSPLSPAVCLSLCSYQVLECLVRPFVGEVVFGGDGSPARPRGSGPAPCSTTTGCLGRLKTKCWHWSGILFGAVSRRSRLPQHCSGSTDRKCAFLLRDLAATADLPPHGA